MKSNYKLECPICSDKIEASIGDGRVIYYIEAYEEKSALRSLIGDNEPDNAKGVDVMLNDAWVDIIEKICDENHFVNIYHCHYTNIDEEHHLFGPAEEPDIHCPNKSCKYRLASHSDHIIRLDKDLSRQYVLRTVSTHEPENYSLEGAITDDIAGRYNQITIQRRCPHCDDVIYFNYTSRSLNSEETYQGVKK